MSLHSLVALEESFNLMYNMLRLVGCELIYSNITAIVVVDLSLSDNEQYSFVEFREFAFKILKI